MDLNRCARCKKRLKLVLDANNRTDFQCLQCDELDPLKTDALKWANSTLAAPLEDEAEGYRKLAPTN